MKYDRLAHLKQLLAIELKSEKPGLLYIEDLQLSIARELGRKLDKENKVDYEMINPSL